ncbi:hypothetical protein [Mycetocola saprophilus]|uniref:hypothetical protein n=1 Tax=Mycetocola saprophilus TaxID=76636 RepID=UPI003BF42D07
MNDTHLVTTNGASVGPLTSVSRPYAAQIRRFLDLLDGDSRWAFSLWRGPEGGHLMDIDLDRFAQSYMQSAGSAQAMVIEVRFIEDDGIARRYGVGRPHGDYTGEPAVSIPYRSDEAAVWVYPSEVFDAAEAAGIYDHYFHTDRVPADYVLRPLDAHGPGQHTSGSTS